VSSAVILVLALRLALTAWPAGRWATF